MTNLISLLSSGLVSLMCKLNLSRLASALACVRFLLPNADWLGGGPLLSVSLSDVKESEEESDVKESEEESEDVSPLDVDTITPRLW